MKRRLQILLFAMLIVAGSTKLNEAKAQAASVSFSIFYNSLKSHGHWINHPGYGQVWTSNVRDFKPYSTGGRWAYTDYGWTWVSSYDWGWAPFHYGRWSYEPVYGWYWVPGYEWAPAWVAWRGGGDYYGWAPLSPGLNIRVGVSFGNSIPNDRWVFAPRRHITSPNINRYYVPRSRNVTIIKNTTVVNNVTIKNNVNYVAGPRKEDVERINHTKIKTYALSNSSRPGKTTVNNNTLNIYRPVIDNDKTVINNNNTTIQKNNNNTTVNNNDKRSTVNRKQKNIVGNEENKTVTNDKTTVDEPEKADRTVKKKQRQNKKDGNNSLQDEQVNKQKAKPAENINAQQTKNKQNKQHDEVVKVKKQDGEDNIRRKK